MEGRKKDYRAYHLASVHDTAKYHVLVVMNALLAQGHRIEIWTGREEQYRARTEDWMREVLGHDPSAIPLRMRGTGENRSSAEVKSAWANEPGNRPDFVFDDRDKTTDAWREIGIDCFQVARNI